MAALLYQMSKDLKGGEGGRTDGILVVLLSLFGKSYKQD